jgi:hypothetical protein
MPLFLCFPLLFLVLLLFSVRQGHSEITAMETPAGRTVVCVAAGAMGELDV